MTANPVGLTAALSVQTLIEMRGQLSDLQRQLGTGKKSDTYAGLGLDRGLVVGLRASLSTLSGYQETITQVGVRLDLASTALSQIDSIARSAKSAVMQSQFSLGSGNQTLDQRAAYIQLDQMLGVLNTSTGGRYLFAGRAVDRPAVEAANTIVDGQGARAGLKQIIEERRLADVGAAGLGRLIVSSPSPTEVALTEDAVSPFGFKLASIVSGLSGSATSGPSGSPATMGVDVGAINSNPGETVRFTFTLPDGSTTDLTMTATNSATPGANEFAIGATPADTATNLQAALTASLGKLAATELSAASAVAASDNFFNVDASNPPQRVDGPPFDTATGLIDGTPANTVSWYLGEAGADSARSTSVARVDQSLVLSYGMRANEEGLRIAVQSVAVFAAMTYSASDPDAEARYAAIKQRLTLTLDGQPGKQKVADIQGDIAAVHNAVQNSKERHQQTAGMLDVILQQADGVSTEEVAAKILALQTSLQATLETTAMMLRTNILEYI
jgi:flagellar hook-associated protein 3 FlgL